MYFEVLQNRLIANVRIRLQNGELTERRLARLTGVSQSHMHNVLKGARLLSPGLADEILRQLRITLLDLFEPDELHRHYGRGGNLAGREGSKISDPGRESGPRPGKSPAPGGPYSPS